MQTQVLFAAILFLSHLQCLAHDSIAKVICSNGSCGSCVVFSVDESKSGDGHLGYALTSHHVVCSGSSIRVRFENGEESSNCFVVYSNSTSDIAVVRLWIPSGIEPVEIFDGEMPEDAELTMIGYPGCGDQMESEGEFLREFRDKNLKHHVINVDVFVAPGFSGGAMLLDGRLVGVTSHGMRQPSSISIDGREISGMTLWPTAATGLDSIRDAIKKLTPFQSPTPEPESAKKAEEDQP